jgi:hypothetical protein
MPPGAKRYARNNTSTSAPPMSKTLFLSITSSPFLTADRAHQRLVACIKPRAKVLLFARPCDSIPHTGFLDCVVAAVGRLVGIVASLRDPAQSWLTDSQRFSRLEERLRPHNSAVRKTSTRDRTAGTSNDTERWAAHPEGGSCATGVVGPPLNWQRPASPLSPYTAHRLGFLGRLWRRPGA